MKDFPEYLLYWNIPAIKFGKKVMRNTNSLIGRYNGADGGKTGFICASGFNVVASATRNGRRLIAVVLGSPSSPVRGAKTAGMLERGFNRNGLSWLSPSLGTVETLQPIAAAPPDLREEMCGKHRKRPAAEDADDDTPTTSADNATGDSNSPTAFMLSNLAPSSNIKNSQLVAPPGPVNPIVVFTGAGKKSAETQVAAAREKLDKKNPKGAKSKQVASADPTAAAAPAATGQSARARPADDLGGAARRLRPAARPLHSAGTRAMPGVAGSNSFMSFTPPASAGPAPLTAMPAATQQTAAVPMPRPRPKVKAN